jgi:hypothetical protein
MLEIFGGFEEREEIGFQVAMSSLLRRASCRVRVEPLVERGLRTEGYYRRQHERRNGQMWDIASDAPMSTSFANSRFLVPFLASAQWALWCDFSDMLFLADPAELLGLADTKYAVMVVKHRHTPTTQQKMDGQVQTVYTRKNWSSLILWNWQHRANARLTMEMVNTLPGRDLHRFCWLEDEEIGELSVEWNYLVGVSPEGIEPKILHFTSGAPFMLGYENGPFADVWKRELAMMDATRGSLRAA